MIKQSFTLLGYEPHTNLSINTKTADECSSLLEIRYEIDTIDHFIIKLISTRMQYALATLKFKLDGKPIPDNGRIIQQLQQRRKWAEEYGLDPKFIESFFKSMIDWYMSQQVAYYESQKPDAETLHIKFCSLAELKAMEFGLDWIDILQYKQLLSSGYQKARQVNEPVLVSFTQETSIFSANQKSTTIHPCSLFEQARHLALSHGFFFSQPSQQFSMVALGSAQQFDVDQNTLSFKNMNKKIVDLTQEEFNDEVKQVVDSGWKRLLLNGIIENRVGKNFSGLGPVLTGGLRFDHQNTCRSAKWSNFSDASFVLSRVQFSTKDNNSYVTFNTIIRKYVESEYETQLINEEIISLLEFCNDLLNGAKQYADRAFDLSFDQPSIVPSDSWEQTVRDGITKINNGDFEKVVLARENEIEINHQTTTCDISRSLTHLNSLYPSSYLYGVLRQGSCFFGVTSTPLVRLLDGQLESTIVADTIEDKVDAVELLDSERNRYEHISMVDLIKSKLESLTEISSLVIPDKPMVLQLAKQQHLYMPVRGMIRNDITLLDLVQALHPIPAVSGSPSIAALQFIREKESLDRGWFAAPVGWIDANNNGEFAVALRSALITESLLSLFAECDIVGGTDPEDKFHETNLKMTTMLLAFGDKSVTQKQ